MPETVEERLRRLEDRLARIESLLAGPPPVWQATMAATGSVDASTAAAMVVEKLDDFTDADWEQCAAQPVEPVTVEPLAPRPPPLAPPRIAATEVARPVMSYERPPPPLPASAPGDFERTIGLKWAGWFGAIVLVIGAGLLIKFAYDQGWFGNLPDAAKLLLMSLGGFGLLAAGEVVLRRVNPLSAVGLYGAGVAVLFLVGYAGYEWYDVYAQGTAFALMAAATLVGILIAARADLVSIAVLSLIGGHLVPIILSAQSTSSVPLLSFLLLLQIMALGLCWWQATPKWWVLRSVSLAATAIWQLALASAGTAAPADTIAALSVFAVIYWANHQSELALTTLRVDRAEQADGIRPATTPWGPIVSLLVTAQAILVLLVVHEDSSAAFRGGLVVAAAGVCVAAGFGLWLTRRSPLADLSVSFRAQAAALLVLAVPVAFDAENVVFGWLVLSVGFGLLAMLRRLRISAIASIVTWLLAIYALGWWVGTSNDAQAHWLTIAGVAISAAVIVTGAAMLVGHAAAAMFAAVLAPASAEREPSRAGPDIAAPVIQIGPAAPVFIMVDVLAGAVWAVAAIFQLPALPGTIALLAYAWLMCGISFWTPARRLGFLAAAAVLVAAIKWTVIDLLQERLAPGAPAAALFNRYQLVGILIAGSIAAIGWSRRAVLLLAANGGEQALRLFRSALVFVVVVVMTLALSIEIAAIVDAGGGGSARQNHTMHLAWTMLWTAAAVIVLLLDRLAFQSQDTAIGLLGAVGVVIVGGKYVLVDALAAADSLDAAAMPILINLQTLAGLVACGGLIAVAYVWPERPLRLLAQAAAVLIVLVIGSLEVDRFAVVQTAAPTWIVRQVGWSIWWSLSAVALVVAGFMARAALLRGFGLALFGLTLLKVVLIDLSGVGSGWRILSFFGLGLLLLGTSVLYGRHGSRLLSDEPGPSAAPPAE